MNDVNNPNAATTHPINVTRYELMLSDILLLKNIIAKLIDTSIITSKVISMARLALAFNFCSLETLTIEIMANISQAIIIPNDGPTINNRITICNIVVTIPTPFIDNINEYIAHPTVRIKAIIPMIFDANINL